MSASPSPVAALLHCTSNFSFLQGASHPDELIEQAHQMGYQQIAITDECSVAGIVRAHVAAEKIGMNLIIGSQFEVCLDDGTPWIRMLMLVKNRPGYAALCTLITHARRRSEKGSYLLTRRDLADALPGVVCIVLPKPEDPATQTGPALEWLKQRYMSRLWLGCSLLKTEFL
jgi:error-prone DNA polymerase